MFLLLSSAAQPRYREDILRCLAAPVGSTIQFRYRKEWIAVDSQNSYNALARSEGLVCFIGDAETGEQPLTPIRRVTIEHVLEHGTTVSLLLKLEDFVSAKTNTFTAQVASQSKAYHPRKENGKLKGKWLFPVNGSSLKEIEHNTSLATWEKVVQELASKPEFANEHFFWTVVGIEPIARLGNDYTESLPWPSTLARNSFNSLLVYHYAPSAQPPLENLPNLTFLCGGSVQSISPMTVRIDSRYDLKRWRFNAQSSGYRSEPGWIGITAPSGWGIELPLATRRSLLAPAALGVLIGLLLGVGGAAAAFRDISSFQDPKFIPSVLVAALSLLGGVLAGLAAVFGIRKSL